MESIAVNLENSYPKAADSIREGLDETLTVHRLAIPGTLRETLCCTNAIESANSVCRNLIRKVSNFKDAAMVLRHTAAGILEADRGFLRVRRLQGLAHPVAETLRDDRNRKFRKENCVIQSFGELFYQNSISTELGTGVKEKHINFFVNEK